MVLINVYIATTENKFRIYFVTFLFNAANLVMYLVNDDRTTAILYIVITVRSLIYIFKDKLKTPLVPIGCILAQLVVGFTEIENIWQLIPIIAPCIVCYYMWFCKTTQGLRIGNIVCNSMWLVYNLKTGLYIVSISRAITVASNTVNFIKHAHEKRVDKVSEQDKVSVEINNN